MEVAILGCCLSIEISFNAALLVFPQPDLPIQCWQLCRQAKTQLYASFPAQKYDNAECHFPTGRVDNHGCGQL